MHEGTTGRGVDARPLWETLDEFVRVKVQGWIEEILEEEVTDLLGREKSKRRNGVDSPSGYRNGYGKLRRLALPCGTVEVRRPRVRDLEERFESRILPLFKRRTEAVGDLLPELYLHGLAQGDFELALRGLLGEGAPLSRASVQRLRAKWEEEYRVWQSRDLRGRELVYMWADGLYVKAGLEKDKAALLVIVGGFSDGTKDILAVSSGVRESTESWKRVLRSLRDRGLPAPRLTIADGHLGIWGALADIYPAGEEQRCWNHKVINVLDHFPRRLQAEARELLCQIPYAETQEKCERLRDRFRERYRQDFPLAVGTLERDWDRMVAFYRFPKEHWKHIRTTNVVESPFSSVRLRTNAAKRYKNVASATALIWKLLIVAEKNFRRLSAPHLLADVFEGVTFVDGNKVLTEQREGAA